MGSGVNDTTLLTALYEASNDATSSLSGKFPSEDVKDGDTVKTPAVKTASDVAGVIAGLNETQLIALSKIISNNLKASSGTELEAGNNILEVGYYLIVDETEKAKVEGQGDAYSPLMLQLTTDITIQPKYDVPQSSKQVEDVNDSDLNDSTNGMGSSADHDIGDTVKFVLTGNITKNEFNYATYEEYAFKFVDEMSAGLTYDEGSAKVYYVDGDDKIDVTDYFPLTGPTEVKNTEGEVTGHELAWGCENVKAIEYTTGDGETHTGLPAGATLVVEYTAKLNENAVIGETGNPNTSHIEFSNNPNGEGTGRTPDTTVTVFTFELNVDKVDQDGTALKDAVFTLYKLIPNDADPEYEVPEEEDDPAITGIPVGYSGTHHWKVVKVMNPDDSGTHFSHSGIDDGYYKLVESTVPAGYNKADDIVFKVTAVHNADGDITSLEVTGGDFTVVQEDGKFTGDIDTTVINTQGLVLPETGGIGTTIFYVVGGALVLAAIVLLITKKRMSKVD